MCSYIIQYISWVSDNQPSWTLNAAGVGPDAGVENFRPTGTQEPMVRALALGPY